MHAHAAAPMASASIEHGVRLRAGMLALGGGVLVLGAKLLAWRLTGSAAVLSDALESFVNVAAGALLLYSLWVSSRPADRNHPYGHGKVEFFSAGVEGTLIAIAALAIVFEAIRALIAGPDLQRLDLGLVLVSAATGLNLLLGVYLLRVGRRQHSLALVADGRHLIADVVTSAGVIVGLLLVRFTGIALFDPIVALAVAAQILVTGWRLVRQAIGGLMDEADPVALAAMVEALRAQREPQWIDAHSLRAWRSGPALHADIHLVVPRYFDADRLHGIGQRVEGVLVAATGRPGEAIVHFDPCRPRHCSGCTVEPCPVRSAPLVAWRPITLERATRGDEALDTGAPVASV